MWDWITMAHSLSSVPATANVIAALSCSTRFSNRRCSYQRLPNLQARSDPCNETPQHSHHISRRYKSNASNIRWPYLMVNWVFCVQIPLELSATSNKCGVIRGLKLQKRCLDLDRGNAGSECGRPECRGGCQKAATTSTAREEGSQSEWSSGKSAS